MEVAIPCEFCGAKMYLIQRDRARSKMTFRCERCSNELVMDWIRIARKPKSAYVGAALHALISQRYVCLSAVGRRAELLTRIVTDLGSLAETVASYVVNAEDGGAKELGFVLHLRR